MMLINIGMELNIVLEMKKFILVLMLEKIIKNLIGQTVFII